eukprot:TRINITY_DN4416_c0_g2_i1.p3 TRINITY_DN4416_c0_g2~~TRINITY_DN4416_c0_g2_i1.p3  ORF type:complete len:302 (-),score=20.22 TRINITY_DN4416_c0_g2_i1:500-1405(-)
MSIWLPVSLLLQCWCQLFFFFVLNSVGFYIVFFLFCIASVASTSAVIRSPVLKICCNKKLVGSIISVIISIVFVVVWVIFRNEHYSWVLQDFFGMCLVVTVLRTLRLQSIKVGAILLLLMLLYDVFFVFITPLFMHGESVMVKVAKGGSSNELLPMLFLVSLFNGNDIALMGYGDVVLPGLLVSFTHIYDIREGKSVLSGYFLYTYIAYALGLCLTYAGIYFQIGGSQGQPALLYLVPCTLGMVIMLGAYKGELKKLWQGELKLGQSELSRMGEVDNVVDTVVVESKGEEDSERVSLLNEI